MGIRRVVTGHTSDGKATIASDSVVEGYADIMTEIFRLWGADEAPTFPDDGSEPHFEQYFPPVGGFRFGVFTVLPQSVEQPKNPDIQAKLMEFDRKLPGLLDHIEKDNPGMHTSDTVDFEYVVSGEVWLELDNGKEVHLRTGDTVVQNGTRHAWRNKGTVPCLMVVCLIGAHRR